MRNTDSYITLFVSALVDSFWIYHHVFDGLIFVVGVGRISDVQKPVGRLDEAGVRITAFVAGMVF